jgi:hypothetical protein
VQGGGDSSTTNKTANDLTTINPQMFSLTTNVSPSGGGTITPASGTAFANGTVVNLQATPNPGYAFVNWTGNVASPNSASTTVTMSSAQTVTANFLTTPGDFDRNGVPDLVLQNDADPRPVVIWYMGGAQGNLVQSSQPVSGGVPGWSVVGVGDMNRDGIPDVILQNDSTGRLGIWYMGGTQGNVFQVGQYVLINGGIAEMPGWAVVAVADVDRNGVPDLVLQNLSTRAIGVWYMGGAQGNVVQSSQWINSAGIPGWKVVGAADFNNDTVPDLIWQQDSTGRLGIWYMGGAQGNVFQSSQWVIINGGVAEMPGWTVVSTSDLDRNGARDLVVQNVSTKAFGVWYMGGAQGNIVQSSAWISSSGSPGWRVIGAK